jgi:hypothetical protein
MACPGVAQGWLVKVAGWRDRVYCPTATPMTCSRVATVHTGPWRAELAGNDGRQGDVLPGENARGVHMQAWLARRGPGRGSRAFISAVRATSTPTAAASFTARASSAWWGVWQCGAGVKA